MKHYSIKVSGRVQGVFYRASAKDEAQRLGIKGIVWNEKDGSVAIEVEGDKSTLDQFVDWCRKGPPAAKVSEVKVIESEFIGYDSFRITH